MNNDDSWQAVAPLKAHQAFVAGTHEVQAKHRADDNWMPTTAFYEDGLTSRYRIREKVILLKVEVPIPQHVHTTPHINKYALRLCYDFEWQRDTALSAIKLAMKEIGA